MDDRFIGRVLVLLLAALTAVGIFALYKTASASGEADFCYVEMWAPTQMAPQYKLSAHRPWRADMEMGVFPTLEEAKRQSDLVGCHLGTK